MAQKPVELILMKQLASSLAMPILLFDVSGNLLYYNEPAETLLGRRYDETGEMALEEWYALLTAVGDDGSPIPPETRPLMIALHKHQPVHQAYRIRAFDGVSRRVEVTAFPLEGQGGRRLGAVAIFWRGESPVRIPLPHENPHGPGKDREALSGERPEVTG